MAPLKSLNIFCGTVEMSLIYCEVNLILIWSVNCFLMANVIDSQLPIFAITDSKLYVPVVTLSSQENAKLLKKLKSCLKRTINWNKYQSKATKQENNI